MEALAASARAGGPRAWLGLIGIGLLFLALRWNNYHAPLIRDEGEYAYAAQLLRHGLAPYQHSFLQKPPMVVYTYLVSNLVAPDAFWFPRVLAAVFIATTTALVGLIARREFGGGVAVTAMALFTPMVLLPEIEQFTANTEMFLLLPLIGAFAVYSYNRENGGDYRSWALAGVLGGAAFWYKYTCLPLLGLLYLFWSWDAWRSHRTARSLWTRWLAAGLGAIGTSVAAIGFFLVQDGGQHLWECTISFNRFYADSINFGFHLFEVRLVWFWTHWWILFLLLPALVIAWSPRLWFWVGLFLLAWVTTNASGYGQYYVLIMPFWAILIAVAIKAVTSWAAAKASWPERLLRGCFALIVLALVCWPDLHSMTLSPQRFAEEKYTGSNPFLESQLVARRVSELTSPSDAVLVAGSEPQVLCYAGRFSPTRFVITAPLMIPTPLAAGYQQEAMQALRDRPPAVVVLARANSSWLMEETSPRQFPEFLYFLLNDQYQQVGGYVREGPVGRWEEPLPPTAMTNATLLVFRRKPG